jgi:hypothetical protein
VKVELLHWRGCPSTDEARELLDRVLAEQGVDTEVIVHEVRTDDEAAALAFPGSPTIRVDGADVDPAGATQHARLTCRIYHVDGRASPVPSREQLETALGGRA